MKIEHSELLEYVKLIGDLKSDKSFTKEEIDSLINKDNSEINLAMALRDDLNEEQLLKLVAYDTKNKTYSSKILISTRTDLPLSVKNILTEYDSDSQWLIVASNLGILQLVI